MRRNTDSQFRLNFTVCLWPSETTPARHVRSSKTRLSPEPCRKPHPKATYCGKPIKASERPLNASEAGQSIARALRGSNPARCGFAIALPKVSPHNRICVVARLSGRRLMNEAKRKYHWLGKSTTDYGRLSFLAKNFGDRVKGERAPASVDKKRGECYPSRNFNSRPLTVK